MDSLPSQAAVVAAHLEVEEERVNLVAVEEHFHTAAGTY